MLRSIATATHSLSLITKCMQVSRNRHSDPRALRVRPSGHAFTLCEIERRLCCTLCVMGSGVLSCLLVRQPVPGGSNTGSNTTLLVPWQGVTGGVTGGGARFPLQAESGQDLGRDGLSPLPSRQQPRPPCGDHLLERRNSSCYEQWAAAWGSLLAHS
jgi:hypothetical protein